MCGEGRGGLCWVRASPGCLGPRSASPSLHNSNGPVILAVRGTALLNAKRAAEEDTTRGQCPEGTGCKENAFNIYLKTELRKIYPSHIEDRLDGM